MNVLRLLRIGLKATVFLIGAAAVVLGAAFLFAPELADATVIVERLVVTVGNDYFLVGGIAAVALLLGMVFAFQGRAGTVRQAETPDAEGAQAVPAPGDDFDDLVEEAAGWRSGDEKEAVRDRVREAAVDVVAGEQNCSRYEAENRIENGGWTADKYAASFLGEGEAPKLPLLTRLQVAYGGSPFKTAVTRTVEEVYEVSGEGEDV